MFSGIFNLLIRYSCFLSLEGVKDFSDFYILEFLKAYH